MGIVLIWNLLLSAPADNNQDSRQPRARKGTPHATPGVESVVRRPPASKTPSSKSLIFCVNRLQVTDIP